MKNKTGLEKEKEIRIEEEKFIMPHPRKPCWTTADIWYTSTISKILFECDDISCLCIDSGEWGKKFILDNCVK